MTVRTNDNGWLMRGSRSFQSVDAIFDEIANRRLGVVKALTCDVTSFHDQCDPDKESLCLEGLPEGTWSVHAPSDMVPPDFPEPAAGINFIRDNTSTKDWLIRVALFGDAWLVAVASFFTTNLSSVSRKRLFTRIFDLPSVYELVSQGFSGCDRLKETECALRSESFVTAQKSLPRASDDGVTYGTADNGTAGHVGNRINAVETHTAGDLKIHNEDYKDELVSAYGNYMLKKELCIGAEIAANLSKCVKSGKFELKAERNRCQELEAALALEKEQSSKLRGSVDVERSKLTKLYGIHKIQMEQATRKSSELELSLEAQNTKLMKLSQIYECGKKQFEMERQMYSELQVSLDAEKSRLIELSRLYERGRAEMENEKEKSKLLQDFHQNKVSELRRVYESSKAQIADLQGSLELEKKKLSDQCRVHERDKLQIADLQDSLESEKSRLFELCRVNECDKAQIADLQDSLESEKKRFSELSRVYECDKAQITDLQESLESERNKFSELCRVYECEKARSAEVQSSLELEKCKLSDQCRVYETEKAQMENALQMQETKALEREKQAMEQEKLKIAEMELEKTNLSELCSVCKCQKKQMETSLLQMHEHVSEVLVQEKQNTLEREISSDILVAVKLEENKSSELLKVDACEETELQKVKSLSKALKREKQRNAELLEDWRSSRRLLSAFEKDRDRLLPHLKWQEERIHELELSSSVLREEKKQNLLLLGA